MLICIINVPSWFTAVSSFHFISFHSILDVKKLLELARVTGYQLRRVWVCGCAFPAKFLALVLRLLVFKFACFILTVFRYSGHFSCRLFVEVWRDPGRPIMRPLCQLWHFFISSTIVVPWFRFIDIIVLVFHYDVKFLGDFYVDYSSKYLESNSGLTVGSDTILCQMCQLWHFFISPTIAFVSIWTCGIHCLSLPLCCLFFVTFLLRLFIKIFEVKFRTSMGHHFEPNVLTLGFCILPMITFFWNSNTLIWF